MCKKIHSKLMSAVSHNDAIALFHQITNYTKYVWHDFDMNVNIHVLLGT